MTPAKIFQIRSLLKGLLNHHDQSRVPDMDSNLVSHSDSVQIEISSLIFAADQTGQQDGLIEIGPRLDIQAGIDLLNKYKQIPQPIRTVRINLNGAETAHGAVIQALLVIQKACTASEKLFFIDGLSSELKAFFKLSGLNNLLVEVQAVENR